MTTMNSISVDHHEAARQAASLLDAGEADEQRTLAERLFTDRFQLLGSAISLCGLGSDPLGHEGLDAFTDRRTEITDISVNGELVTVRFVFHGVHRGRFHGRRGKGERRTATGLALLLFDGGRIDRACVTLRWA